MMGPEDAADRAPSPPLGAEVAARDRAVRRVLLIEGAANLLVLVAKATAGALTGSFALLSDALESLHDVGNNAVALLVMRQAARPPDRNHPYGHRKFEPLAVFALAVLLALLALELMGRALFAERSSAASSPVALVLVVGAALAGLVLSAWEHRKARELSSQILHADAGHTLADVLTTGVGVLGWQFAVHGVAWMEVAATFLIGLFVMTLAYRLFRRTLPILSDGGAIDPEELQLALRTVPGVEDVRQARSRWLGEQAFVDVVVVVDAALPTSAAHRIADRVEEVLESRFGVRDVSVHVEPSTLGPSREP